MIDQRLRDAAQDVKEALANSTPPEDLGPIPQIGRSMRAWRPILIVAGLFVATLLLLGLVPLLLSSADPSSEEAADVYTGDPTSVTVPLAEVQGVVRSGSGVLWAWDSEGNVAAKLFSHWSAMPPLTEPLVDVAEHDGTPWAITTNRCDPSLPDWEGVECETTLWSLVEEDWSRVPSLDGISVPDNMEDIEFDSTGTLWIVTSDGLLISWDGAEAVVLVTMGQPNDGISISADGTVWVSRFNPFFPDDIGFARLDDQGGAFEAASPLDSENRHAVMTANLEGDLWVWFSGFPSKPSLSGEALGFYDGETGEWTVYRSDLPEGFVRSMDADGDAVWLVVNSQSDGLWRFDGQTWTRLHTRPGAEILDVAAEPDGPIWYVEDQVLQEVER